MFPPDATKSMYPDELNSLLQLINLFSQAPTVAEYYQLYPDKDK